MAATRVYIDGFNLYYGALRDSRLHWLDLQKFARQLNRNVEVDRVVYCTAMVSSTPDDPNKAQRQHLYHRALSAACPKLETVLGQFATHTKRVVLAGCGNCPTCLVKAVSCTEKGSDVNLAARLLHDAHMNHYDRAIVVSGDSDLVEPIRLVVSEVKKTIWVRNPRPQQSAQLAAVASDYSRIKLSVIAASQLPDSLIVGGQRFHKPPEWSKPLSQRNRKIIFTAPCTQSGCGNSADICRFE